MPRIRFTADPKLPRDLAHLGYRKDTEVDLIEDQAQRWMRRGVAEIVPDPVKASPARMTPAKDPEAAVLISPLRAPASQVATTKA